jgi:hypothetical protein
MEADDSYCTEGATAWKQQAVAANAMARLCGEGDKKCVSSVHELSWDFDRKCEVVFIYSGISTNNYGES